MDESVWEYAKRFAQLDTDGQLAPEQYWAAAQNLAGEAVQHLGDDAPMLLGPISRLNRMVYASVTAALEQLACMPEMLSSGSSSVSLALLPITLMYRSADIIPRSVGVHTWAPPLPDGRNVPGLLDFVLTWEEVTTSSRTRHLLDVLERLGPGFGHEEAEQLLSAQFGDTPKPSQFDTFDYQEDSDRYSALRFAPALLRSTDKPWFADSSDRQAWCEKAFHRHEQSQQGRFWLYPQYPLPFNAALAAGEKHLLSAWLDGLFETARAEGLGDEDLPLEEVFVLIEAFGNQITQLATSYRFSILERATWRSLAHGEFFVPIPREHAFWEEVSKKFSAIARERLGLANVVAPLVQEAEVWLIKSAPTKRFLAVFGPMGGLDEPVPDGFPLESYPLASDDYTRWWFYERQGEGSNAQIVARCLAEALNLRPTSFQVRATFALWGGRWRPAFVTDLEQAVTTGGDPIDWPPEQETVEKIRDGIRNDAARAWVHIEHSPVSEEERSAREPEVHFILGPPTDEGGRAGFDHYQEAVAANNEELMKVWEDFERGYADIVFGRKEGRPSAMEDLFSEAVGAPVRIDSVDVTWAHYRGLWVTVFQIPFSSVWVASQNQATATWPPSQEAVNGVGVFIGQLLKREWMIATRIWV
jgi:hypothetical protein